MIYSTNTVGRLTVAACSWSQRWTCLRSRSNELSQSLFDLNGYISLNLNSSITTQQQTRPSFFGLEEVWLIVTREAYSYSFVICSIRLLFFNSGMEGGKHVLPCLKAKLQSQSLLWRKCDWNTDIKLTAREIEWWVTRAWYGGSEFFYRIFWDFPELRTRV